MPALSASYTHAPATDNTAAVVTLPALSGGYSIRQVICSYNATPTDGKLTIENGSGNIQHTTYITTAGAAPIEFVGAVQGSDNTAVIITLAAGGDGVKGAVNVVLAN